MSKTDKSIPREERRERPRMEPYKRQPIKDWEQDEDDEAVHDHPRP